MTQRFDIEAEGCRLGHTYAKSVRHAAKRFVNGGWCNVSGALGYDGPVDNDGHAFVVGDKRFVVRPVRWPR